MCFDACAATEKGGYRGTGYVLTLGGGLTWERGYTSNVKHMCRGDNSWPYADYCPY
jgi:hypothetical protein